MCAQNLYKLFTLFYALSPCSFASTIYCIIQHGVFNLIIVASARTSRVSGTVEVEHTNSLNGYEGKRDSRARYILDFPRNLSPVFQSRATNVIHDIAFISYPGRTSAANRERHEGESARAKIQPSRISPHGAQNERSPGVRISCTKITEAICRTPGKISRNFAATRCARE